MRILLIVALIVVCAAAAFGQTAQVIQLTPDEAKQAAALYAERAAVEAKIETLRVSISVAHFPSQKQQDRNLILYDTTWLNGFVYSTDFKYIVPAPFKTSQSTGAVCTNWMPSTGVTLTSPLTTAPLYFTQ